MNLRIATWNVERPTATGWKRSQRNPIINQKLKEINADIWILTETHQVITPGEGYASLSTAKADFHKDGECRATIWSRYPIITPIETFDSKVAVCGEIETGAGKVMVYGSIITWAHNKGKNGQSKLWEEHYKAITAHGKDWAELSQRGTPMCVAGDFNETLNESGWYGTQKGRAQLTGELERSNLECLTSMYRVDHICVTKGWASTTAVHRWDAPDFEGKPVSDHPVYAVDLCFETL